MKLISWNVNGINSCIQKGLVDFMLKEDADFYLFQEVKSSQGSLNLPLNISTKYHSCSFPAEKAGYSGLLIYCKQKPIAAIKGIGEKEFDSEARVLTLEFERFFLINAYFPHSNRELVRLSFKLRFNEAFAKFCEKLKEKNPSKAIIIGGDLNVAHKEIDLANPRENRMNAGFTIQERDWLTNFLKQGYVDSFRHLNDGANWYTWWSYRNTVRERNIGWRIDYFLVDETIRDKIKIAKIHNKILGSDHCPISLELTL